MAIRHCLPGRSSAERAFNVECRPDKQWHTSVDERVVISLREMSLTLGRV